MTTRKSDLTNKTVAKIDLEQISPATGEDDEWEEVDRVGRRLEKTTSPARTNFASENWRRRKFRTKFADKIKFRTNFTDENKFRTNFAGENKFWTSPDAGEW